MDCVGVLLREKLKFQRVVLILTCCQQNRNQSKACSQLRILKKLKIHDEILPLQCNIIQCTISFNAADSGPYYQVMINTIAEAGPGVKGPTGYYWQFIFRGGNERN